MNYKDMYGQSAVVAFCRSLTSAEQVKGFVRRIRQIKRINELCASKDLKLNLGCGPNNFKGWVNIDKLPRADLSLDLTRSFPFPSECAEYIFVEHFLEHLGFVNDVPKFLRECHRVLKKGGTVRIIVPDIALFVDAYQRRDLSWFKFVEPGNDFSTPCEGMMYSLLCNGQHLSGWDYETLSMKLKAAGFADICRTEYGKSSRDGLNRDWDSPVRAAHSICVEATK